MASDGFYTDWTFLSGADLTNKKFLCATLGSGGTITVVAATGVDSVGIIQDEPAASNRATQVRVFGITKAVAGAALNPGQLVAPNNAGKVVAALANNYVIGRVLIGCANADELCTVLVSAPGFKA